MTSTELLRRALKDLCFLLPAAESEMGDQDEVRETIELIRSFLPPTETTVVPNEVELQRGRFNTPPELDVNQQRPLGDYLTGVVKLERFLGTDTLHEGCFVRLTSGQRAVLRDMYGMTPTAIVEIVGFDFYPHEVHEAISYAYKLVRAVTIRSTTPADQRKHILSLVRIDRFGEFLQRAADREIADAEGKTNNESNTSKTKKGPSKTQLEAELLAEYV